MQSKVTEQSEWGPTVRLYGVHPECGYRMKSQRNESKVPGWGYRVRTQSKDQEYWEWESRQRTQN